MGDEERVQWSAAVVVVRTLLGWTQHELAERSGVSAATISRAEKGVMPREEIRERIERGLGIHGWSDLLCEWLGKIERRAKGRREGLVDSGRAEEAGELASDLVRQVISMGVEELRRIRGEAEEESVGWAEGVVVMRNLQGMGQEVLAARAGINLKTLQRLEVEAMTGLEELREKVERALGIQGWSGALREFLGDLRTRVKREGEGLGVLRGSGEAGEAASNVVREAISVGLEEMRRAREEQS